MIALVTSGRPNPPTVDVICIEDEQAMLAHVPESDVLTWPWVEDLALDRDIEAAFGLLDSVMQAEGL